MELRSLLTSGHSVALGVLAPGAVQSALTLAMAAGSGSPPMGWTPMPGPADGGVGSPHCLPLTGIGLGGRARLSTVISDALIRLSRRGTAASGTPSGGTARVDRVTRELLMGRLTVSL